MIISMTIERTVNGRPIESKAQLSSDGWSQWGETSDRLSETCGLVEALQDAFNEHAQDVADGAEDEDA